MELSPKLITFIVLIIIMLVCSFVLQGLLSKYDNPWIGTILPLISFVLATFFGMGRLIIHRKLGLDIILKDFLLLSVLNFATIVHLMIFFIRRKIKPAISDEETNASED